VRAEVNGQRWSKAQRAERSFWGKEAVASRHLDSSGNERLARIEDELAFFDFEAVRGQLASADCVVEIGCGPIGIIHFLETQAMRVGIDPLMRAVERSGLTNRRGVARLEARGEEVPLHSQSADLVICYNALDHAESPPRVLAEIRRILKPGGRLLLQLHTIREGAAMCGRLLSWLDPPHPFHFSKSQVLRLVNAAGFELESDGSIKRAPRQFPLRELLSYDGLRHLGSNVITESITNLRLRKPIE
jgi:SAM-dependent methyltransferase